MIYTACGRFFRRNWLLVISSLALFFIPFTWFEPGYVDLGGDSSRLYFYDPINFLRHFVLNPFLPDSFGVGNGGIYLLPFTILMVFLKGLVVSPYLVVCIYNGLSLVAAFAAVYAICQELFIGHYQTNPEIRKYAGTAAGLFYVFIPMSSLTGWDLPLITHSHRFVYPLLFYLFLRYVVSGRFVYMLFALALSFFFAHNVSFVGVPYLLPFFSVGTVYLMYYALGIRKKKLRLGEIVAAGILFLGLHAFQFLPLLHNVLEGNSDISASIATGNAYDDTVKYISAITDFTRYGHAFFGTYPFLLSFPTNAAMGVFLVLIILMLALRRSTHMLVLFSLFLFLYYMVTAKVTHLGYALYKGLFLVPVFVMFRNFYGKWIDIFIFIYSILVGFSIAFATAGYAKNYKGKLVAELVVILILNALPFLNGTISNRILTKDTGIVVKGRLVPDRHYEDFLEYVRAGEYRGRSLSLPLADFNFQILAGENQDGAYLGPSIAAYLAGQNDFSSLLVFRPFSMIFAENIRDKDYHTASNVFPLLGIQTVFYNSDPYIYEAFETFPYNEAKQYMPKTQREYIELMRNFPVTREKDFGEQYHLYSVNSDYYLPLLYLAHTVEFYDEKEYGAFGKENYKLARFVVENFREEETGFGKAIIAASHQDIDTVSSPDMKFTQLSPSKYRIAIKGATEPYLLVFSHMFNKNWKLFPVDHPFENAGLFETFWKKPVADSSHVLANGFANAWYITPSDTNGESDYTLILEMTSRRYTYLGLIVSGISFLALLFILAREIFKK